MAPASTLTVGSRELKNRLGTYLRKVRSGTTILVTDRGDPVAELRPLAESGDALEKRLRALELEGLVQLPTRSDLTPFEPMEVSGTPISETLIADREDRF